jgi:hypothetical protein
MSSVPEFIDPVFAKTCPKRSVSLIEDERFGLVFAKTGFINSGTVLLKRFVNIFLSSDWFGHCGSVVYILYSNRKGGDRYYIRSDWLETMWHVLSVLIRTISGGVSFTLL